MKTSLNIQEQEIGKEITSKQRTIQSLRMTVKIRSYWPGKISTISLVKKVN